MSITNKCEFDLTREQAAAYLGLSRATLETWACTGRYDLQFAKIGGRVRYRKADLDDFLVKRTATSTGALVSKVAA